MKELVPWRCRVLKLLGRHLRWYVKDAETPIPHVVCRGCSHMRAS